MPRWLNICKRQQRPISFREISIHLFFPCLMRNPGIFYVIEFLIVDFLFCFFSCCCLFLLGFEANRGHPWPFPFPFDAIDNHSWRWGNFLLPFSKLRPIQWKESACISLLWRCDRLWINSRQCKTDDVYGLVDNSNLNHFNLNGGRGGVHSDIEFLVDEDFKGRPI